MLPALESLLSEYKDDSVEAKHVSAAILEIIAFRREILPDVDRWNWIEVYGEILRDVKLYPHLSKALQTKSAKEYLLRQFSWVFVLQMVS